MLNILQGLIYILSATVIATTCICQIPQRFIRTFITRQTRRIKYQVYSVIKQEEMFDIQVFWTLPSNLSQFYNSYTKTNKETETQW